MLQPLCYPYYGSDRRYRVHQPTYFPSAEWVIAFVYAERITLVYVGSQPTVTSVARWYQAMEECLADHPDQFRTVDKGSWGQIFRVVPVTQVGADSFGNADPLPRPHPRRRRRHETVPRVGGA